MDTAETSREERLAEIIAEIQEADAAIANVNKRIMTEGPSVALMQQQRDAIAHWNSVLSRYAQLRAAVAGT